MKGYAVAEQDQGQTQEGEVVPWIPFIPNANAPVLFEPTDRSLDVPTEPSQTAAVRASSFGNDRLNVSATKLLTVPFVIVPAIALQSIRTSAWATNLTGNGRNVVYQWYGFLHIVPVCSG